jgi:cyclohexanone monooxygenase
MPTSTHDSPHDSPHDVDAVVVGAGFSGIYMTHQLSRRGLSVRAFEAGSTFGGTWFWNTYPGARCDCGSMEYSFSFDRDLLESWQWSERYPAQPEIQAYLEHAADHLDVRRHFTFDTRVESLVWDDAASVWVVTTDGGEQVRARYAITAVGCLSTGQTPDFAGIDAFRGETYHTAAWPKEGVDLTGKRVGVIGTGSSGVQVIPIVAEQAEHLTVFQRTPAFSLDCANRPLREEERREFIDNLETYRTDRFNYPAGLVTDVLEVNAMDLDEEERTRIFEERWARHRAPDILMVFPDLFTDRAANETAAEFFRSKIRAVVEDPELAEALSPRTYPLGAKRITMDTGYFQTYNRDDVTLVSVADDPITGLTETGLATRDREFELDVVIFATGFDAITGPLLAMDIRGRGGQALRDRWVDGPSTYLGVGVDGFPNLFTITGPQSPNVLTNVVVAIEQHVEWISGLVDHLEATGSIAEPSAEAVKQWTHDAIELADQTLYPEGNSWYTGANIPGKPRVIMSYVGGVPAYVAECDAVAADGYRGFELTKA